MATLADAWLPRPHLLHPWPSERFAVRHPRWEPSPNWARSDLCGGRSVMGVPTAIYTRYNAEIRPELFNLSLNDCARAEVSTRPPREEPPTDEKTRPDLTGTRPRVVLGPSAVSKDILVQRLQGFASEVL